MRTFRDESQRSWVVFNVTPDALVYGRVEALPAMYADGWLVFESDGERRRLAPAPADWESHPIAALRLLLSRAEVVRTRRVQLLNHPLDGDGAESPSELR